MFRLATALVSLFVLLTLAGSCGSVDKSAADCGMVGEKDSRNVIEKQFIPCKQRTRDEEIRRALDAGDLSRAIDLLVDSVAEDDAMTPPQYTHRPQLAAAYAARGHFDMLSVVEQTSPNGGAGASLVEEISSLLPSPNDSEAYSEAAQGIDLALATLTRIPNDLIAAQADDAMISAGLQLPLYMAAKQLMFLDQFIVSPTSGQLDPSGIQNMSEDQAAAFIDNLQSSSALAQAVGHPELQGQIDAALAAIDAEPGETTKDKIAAYCQTGCGGQTVPP